MTLKVVKRDVKAALQREIAAGVASHTKLLELQADRARILHSDDDNLQGVVAVDQAIAAQAAICKAHGERRAALEAELAAERLCEREKAKEAAVAQRAASMAVYAKAAVELEKSLISIGEKYAAYQTAMRKVTAGWPSELFPPLSPQSPFWLTDSVHLSIAGALAMDPAGAAVRLAEIGPRIAALGIGDAAARIAESFIANLRDAPLPPDSGPNDESEAA